MDGLDWDSFSVFSLKSYAAPYQLEWFFHKQFDSQVLINMMNNKMA